MLAEVRGGQVRVFQPVSRVHKENNHNPLTMRSLHYADPNPQGQIPNRSFT